MVAGHPRQTLATAAALAAVAALTGRPLREVALVLATVLVGQLLLAWHHDIVDRERDARHEVPHKPVADGWLTTGNAWYACAVAALVVVPLSVSHGLVPGLCYLGSLVAGLTAHSRLRRTPLSWLPWAVAWALYPPFLGAGGWDGKAGADEPVSWAMVGLFAALGVSLHVLRSLPGLVDEREDGWHSLPLLVAVRTGATKLLVVASVAAAVVLALILFVGQSSGLGGATLG